jgi:chorismate mutase
MANNVRFDTMHILPNTGKAKLGLGKFRIKVIQHENEEIIAKATQELMEVKIRLTQLKDDRAKTIELTEKELHKIQFTARGIRKMTGFEYVADDMSFDLE